MTSTSIGGSDDPVGIMMSVTTGGRGVESITKMYQEGSDEVKDLLKHEADIIFECRYCKNLYRSIANFIAHKRQYCRSFCRSSGVYETLTKHVEDIGNKIANNNNDKEKRKAVKTGRVNIVNTVQKKIQSTVVEDELNRVELYTLPSIVRHAPTTTIDDGYQKINEINPMMALKELLPDDTALLLMPQDDSRKRQTDMNLRKKARVDVEEKTMTGRELIVLDYIYKDILKQVNPASCQCLFSKCKPTKTFSDILTLAYHLTIQHNRPMTVADHAKVGRGKEGWYTCFLCRNVLRSYPKLLLHVEKEHGEIKKKHEEDKQRKLESLAPRMRKKAQEYMLERVGSLSPIPDSPEPDDTSEVRSELSTPSKRSLTPRVGKKKKRKVNTSGNNTTNTVDEGTTEDDNTRTSFQEENDDENNEIEEEEEPQRNDYGPSPPSSNGDMTRSQSREPTEGSNSQGERRSRRIRRPKAVFEFESERPIRTTHTSKKKQKVTSSNDVTASTEVIEPKIEVIDSEFTQPEEQQLTEIPQDIVPPPTNMSPIKVFSREALTQSILRARTTSPIKPSTPKKSWSGWVMPSEGPGSSKSSSSISGLTPLRLGQTDRNPIKKLIIKPIRGGPETESPDVSNNNHEKTKTPEPMIPRTSSNARTESDTKYPIFEDKLEKVDLDTLTISFLPEDEAKFFRPLKKMNNGTYICMECMEVFKDEEQGKRHMLGHVRVVRFRCALCDCGAFYLEDLRQHLMKKCCPGIRFAPQNFIIKDGGSIVMKQEHADSLIQIVHTNKPGQYRYTNGRIVTEFNYHPFYPDATIERRIME